MSTSTEASSDSNAIPAHVAVIMDGNGRWAQRRGMPRVAGHRKGLERARELINVAGERGIRYVTLFVFSSENWRRPQEEVSFLLELFLSALDREIAKLHQNNVQFRVIGDTAGFSDELTGRIAAAEELTRANNAMTLTLAANYGGHWDITQACAQVAQRVATGAIAPSQITAATLAQYLSTRDMLEPDLFIRTGGEQRISNFLLWQLAYTELYFTPTLWPDFDRAQFEQALDAYANRQRRFGLTGEQVESARDA